MKIIGITQARFGSTRLPGKILKKINGKSLLQIHLERAAQSKLINKIIVATTTEKESVEIENIAVAAGHTIYKGSVTDVLDRFYKAAKTDLPHYIVRITSDCPLIDADIIDEVINCCISNSLDYCSNTLQPTYPDGMDVEVFSFNALEKAWKEATSPSDREHVTPYIWRNSSFSGGTFFKSENVKYNKDYSSFRLTVDEQKDFKVIEELIKSLGSNQPWKKYVDYLEANPNIKKINLHIKRNEGLIK